MGVFEEKEEAMAKLQFDAAFITSLERLGLPPAEGLSDLLGEAFEGLRKDIEHLLRVVESEHEEGAIELYTTDPRVGDIICSEEFERATEFPKGVVRVNYPCGSSHLGNKRTPCDDPTRAEAHFAVVGVNSESVTIVRLDEDGNPGEEILVYDRGGEFALKTPPKVVMLAPRAEAE